MTEQPIARLSDGVVTEPARDVPVFADVDVLVAGGGSAGWHAAVAAARQGARTLLIERHGTLGGTMTNAMVQPFMSYHDPVGRAVVGGVWQEMVDRLTELGGSTGPAMAADGNPPWGKNPSVTPFEPEVLRFVAQELVLESGAQLLLHTWIAGAIKEGDELRGLIVEGKSGRQAILAKCVVDATGDADVAALAGAPYAIGRETDHLTMPMTLYVKMGGVDYGALRDYVESNQDDLRWWAFPKVDPNLGDEFEKAPVSVSGFVGLVREARERGELNLGRETINILPCPRRGEAVLNCTRVSKLDPTSTQDLTTAEVEARRQAMSVVAFARRRMPGFANAELLAIAPTIGVRESRRIVGEYVLDLEDVVSCRRFPDVIARSAYNVDIHNPHDDKSTWHEIEDAYDIPYRCLVPREVEHLLVAGRCISTTHEASGSARMTPHVAATGEAAGTAAALAAAAGVPPRDIDLDSLQSALVRAGAILGEGEPAPA
jgi:hypothetical protein